MSSVTRVGASKVSFTGLRCLVHGPASGAWNMAVDEALMESARGGRVTLRFYRWEPGCLSFGRNQAARGRYDLGAAARRGYDVVRRPTGGRSVLHHRELTYSVTAPAGAWGGLPDAYLRINCALAAGLRLLGVDAEVASSALGGAPRPGARACFRDPLPGEVTAAGRKLVGSAQWRERGALLQHGSILIHNDQAVVEELCLDGPTGEVPAAGLAELIERVPPADEVATVLAGAFATELDLELQAVNMSPEELSAARSLRGRYLDERWTWRR